MVMLQRLVCVLLLAALLLYLILHGHMSSPLFSYFFLHLVNFLLGPSNQCIFAEFVPHGQPYAINAGVDEDPVQGEVQNGPGKVANEVAERDNYYHGDHGNGDGD